MKFDLQEEISARSCKISLAVFEDYENGVIDIGTLHYTLKALVKCVSGFTDKITLQIISDLADDCKSELIQTSINIDSKGSCTVLQRHGGSVTLITAKDAKLSFVKKDEGEEQNIEFAVATYNRMQELIKERL